LAEGDGFELPVPRQISGREKSPELASFFGPMMLDMFPEGMFAFSSKASLKGWPF
jgi:hypothetical protein